MSSVKERRHFTGQEKVAILRRHLLEKVPVSDLCEEHRINPTLFYRWQKEWFEQGAVVFNVPKGRGRNGRSEDAAAKRITALPGPSRASSSISVSPISMAPPRSSRSSLLTRRWASLVPVFFTTCGATVEGSWSAMTIPSPSARSSASMREPREI